jgi:hypothetical protein
MNLVRQAPINLRLMAFLADKDAKETAFHEFSSGTGD